MIFSQKQINEIINIIKFQHILFSAGNIGIEVLSPEEINILSGRGIDIEQFKNQFSPYEQLFYFGRLAAILNPLQAKDVSFVDFKKYLRRGQYIPLSTAEKASLTYLRDKSFSYIKGLGDTITSEITGKIQDENLAKRNYYENVIGESIKRTIIEKDTVKNIVLEIGGKTKDWERDLGRIAETELQNAYEYGKGSAFNDIYGDAKIYYKQVYPGACKHCIRLYLKNGISSTPILFTYQDLLDNGTNIGKKVNDWKPVLGTVHPFCRCDLRVKRSEDDVWGEESGMFTPPTVEKSKGKIKIKVGDKTYEV